MPVDPQLRQSIQALFGPAFHVSQPYTPKHDGVDIGAPDGTPLHAIAAGTVSYARNENDDPKDAWNHWAVGGGNVVNIDITKTQTLQYAHLKSFVVKRGEKVAAGQLIGRVGATGHATGPHVHFGLWDHSQRKMVHPYSYLAGLAGHAPAAVHSAKAAPPVKAQLSDVERFPAPRHFLVRPGSTLRGYHPAQPNEVVRKHDFPTASGAHAAAIVRIHWPGMDPQPVPHGVFLLVVDGFFKDVYIPANEVDLDPPPG